MNQIVWSDLAYLSFTDIANYLTEHYSINSAIRFDEDVEDLLKKLEFFEHLCPTYERRPILRKCIISRYPSSVV